MTVYAIINNITRNKAGHKLGACPSTQNQLEDGCLQAHTWDHQQFSTETQESVHLTDNTALKKVRNTKQNVFLLGLAYIF